MREYLPRWFSLVIISVIAINLALIYSHPMKRDPEFVMLVRLLRWRDPETGHQLYLPVDRSLPIEQQTAALKNIEELDLSFSALTVLPPEIAVLTNLRWLYLEDNALKALPPEIGRLENLSFLTLNNNQLSELPPELFNLRNLVLLDVSNNQLTEIPPQIGQLTNLRELWLNDNELTTLPVAEIVKLSELQTIWVQNNKLHAPLYELDDVVGLRVYE